MVKLQLVSIQRKLSEVILCFVSKQTKRVSMRANDKEQKYTTALKRYVHHHIEMQIQFLGLDHLVHHPKYLSFFTAMEELNTYIDTLFQLRINNFSLFRSRYDLFYAINQKIDGSDKLNSEWLSDDLKKLLPENNVEKIKKLVANVITHKQETFINTKTGSLGGGFWHVQALLAHKNKQNSILYDSKTGEFLRDGIVELAKRYAEVTDDIGNYIHDKYNLDAFYRLRDKIKNIHSSTHYAYYHQRKNHWPIFTLSPDEISNMSKENFLDEMSKIYDQYRNKLPKFSAEEREFTSWFNKIKILIEQETTVSKVFGAWYAYEVNRDKGTTPLTKVFPADQSNETNLLSNQLGFDEMTPATHRRIREKLHEIKRYLNPDDPLLLINSFWELKDTEKYSRDKDIAQFAYFTTNY